MKTIFYLFPLLLLGCQAGQPLLQGNDLDLDPYVGGAPIKTKGAFRLQRMPEKYDADAILREANSVVTAVHRWLGYSSVISVVPLLIFSPEESVGQSLLRGSKLSNKAAGRFVHDRNMLLVVGIPGDPLFWTALRHEAVHFAMESAFNSTDRFPFWLNEGIATLFEQGVDDDNRPLPNPNRLRLLSYLAGKRPGLDFTWLIEHPVVPRMDGRDYARAWGLVSFLYWQQRPLPEFMQGRIGSGKEQRLHFERKLLLPGESIADFEKKVKRWIDQSASSPTAAVSLIQ